MCNLQLADFLLLREEILCIINEMTFRGFSLDDNFARIDFQKIRYKRLVRLYERLDSVILDLLEDFDSNASVEDVKL